MKEKVGNCIHRYREMRSGVKRPISKGPMVGPRCALRPKVKAVTCDHPEKTHKDCPVAVARGRTKA